MTTTAERIAHIHKLRREARVARLSGWPDVAESIRERILYHIRVARWAQRERINAGVE